MKRHMLSATCCAAVVVSILFAVEPGPARAAPADSTVLVGTTPAGESLLALLELPVGHDSWLRWRLTLQRDPLTQAPASYQLQCDMLTVDSVRTDRQQRLQTVERRGNWTLDRGRRNDLPGDVIRLENAFNLVQLDANVAHLLNADGTLMVADGGWSYTLYRESSAEAAVRESDVVFPQSDSYKLLPRAAGPDVLGIFGGRSPITQIWRQLDRTGPLDAMKAKWRLTLFQDPQTGAPTTYRLEGTLYRAGLQKDPQETREGTWTIAEHPSTKAVVYELGPWKSEPALRLLRGDDNVLFFLDRNHKLLVGNGDFSYTLNRTSGTVKTAAARP